MNRWITWILIFTAIIFLSTFIPIYVRSTRFDTTRQDILLHHGFMEDYETYLSAISQGQHGSLFWTDPHHLNPLLPVPLFTVFTIAGLLTAPFHMWPPYVYHLLRALGIAAMLLTTYALFKQCMKNSHWAAIGTFISLIVTVPPDFLYRNDVTLRWWSDLSMLGRIDELPHHLFAEIFFITSVLFYFRFLESAKLRHLSFSMILISMAIYTVPQTVFPFFFMFIVGESIRWIIRFKNKIRISISDVLLYGACMLPPVASVIHLSVVTSDPIWKATKIWEVQYFRQDPWAMYHGYISYAFLFIPTIAAIISVFHTRRFSIIQLLGVWVFTPLLAYPFLNLFSVGTGRLFTQSYLIIPMSILSTVAVRNIIQNSKRATFVAITVLVLLVVWGLYDTGNQLYNESMSISQEPIQDEYYTPKLFYDAVMYINHTLPHESILLATPKIGSLISSFAPVYTYIGVQTHATNWDIDTSQTDTFFTNALSDEEAINLLHQHHIQYVVYAKPPPTTPYLSYPFLQMAWENGRIRIYKVL